MKQGFIDNSWVRLDQRDEDRSELSIFTRELDRKGGEYEVEVAPIREVSRTEEGGTELSICERPLRNRLRDRALACPGQPVQPVDRRPVDIPCPEFDLVQDGNAGSFQTSSPATVPILCCPCTAKIVEDSYLSCRNLMSGAYRKRRIAL